MTEALKWKAEIKFEGTADDFNKMVTQLDRLPVEISIPEWGRRPVHFDGCMPLPIGRLIGMERLEKLVTDLPRIQIKFIRDIRGGLRMAHVHLSDEIVLLDQTRFKALVAGVAHDLGEMRAETIEDYIEVMDAVGRLDPSFQPR